MPKKGSRSITVDGSRYRFVVSEVYYPGNDEAQLTVIIQEDVKGPTPTARFHGIKLASIVPKDVAHNIRRAIAKGWVANKKTLTFANDWEEAPAT